MTLRLMLILSALFSFELTLLASQPFPASDDVKLLAQTDAAMFHPKTLVNLAEIEARSTDPNLVWTDASGRRRNRSEALRLLRQGLRKWREDGEFPETGEFLSSTTARAYGYVGIVQEDSGELYVLRVWVKRATAWRLLVYQQVRIGAPPAEAESGDCQNPCRTVPFVPKNQDESDVIHAYQAVERAVTANDSKAWGTHIAEEFFAVTSNSDSPLDKATRMAGLDKQKAGGIAPFPLASARMFEFGDAMVMISTQQPLHGRPLHVTRVWFKRDGAWVEAYSYQTTIQAGLAAH